MSEIPESEWVDVTDHVLLSSVYTRTPTNQDRVAQAAKRCGCEACAGWLWRNGYIDPADAFGADR